MIIHKTVASGGDGLEFVLSDATVDRYGDVVEPDGWDLKNFKKNPIALFGHNSNFPIGKWTDLRVDAGRLIGRLMLAKRGTSYRLDELIGLVEQGILRAVSVGFRPVKSEPLDPEKPYGPQRYRKQELLETSLVSVPANPAALSIAKAMNVSDEIMTLAFGEHAETRRRDMANGEHAANRKPEAHASSYTKGKTMKTVSQRLEEAQNKLAVRQQRHTEVLNAEELDTDALQEIETDIDKLQKEVDVLSASEKKIAKGSPAAPGIVRRPLGFPKQNLSGVDLLVRRALVHGVSLHTGQDVAKVLEQRYPDRDEATELAVMTRAAAPLATTGTSGFVSQLVQSTWMDFLAALTGKSVYPELKAGGRSASFDAAGTAYMPQRTGSGANGSFFGEGSPIRVGRVTVTAPTFTSRKMGVIIPFSREAAKRSTPDLEGVLRQSILEDTAIVLDTILLDATAEDSIRPAGLLNGVSATATGYGGGDHVAVKADFKALLQPFIDAKAAGGISVIMNPAQSLSIAMMDGPDNNANWFQAIRDRVRIIESENATAGRLIAVRNADFATALGDMPEFEVSNQATIHMEDTSPAEIVSATGPATANPVRSFFQTDSLGLRMIMDVSWKMARSGVVHWIDGTSY